jgi:hypothetical protein
MAMLRKRLTHKYVGQYQHLDSWKDIGEMKVISKADAPDENEDDPDPCDAVTHFKMVQVNQDDDVSDDEIAEALADSFSSQGCGCEHDCCGCRSYSVSQVEKCDRLNYGHRDSDHQIWLVVQGSSRNF